MTTHPLSCSTEFSIANCVDIAGQSFYISSGPFGICALLSQNLCVTPLSSPLFFPSAEVYRIAGDDKEVLRKKAWIAPASGMFLLNLAGRVSYELMPGGILKGLIFGVHS